MKGLLFLTFNDGSLDNHSISKSINETCGEIQGYLLRVPKTASGWMIPPPIIVVSRQKTITQQTIPSYVVLVVLDAERKHCHREQTDEV